MDTSECVGVHRQVLVQIVATISTLVQELDLQEKNKVQNAVAKATAKALQPAAPVLSAREQKRQQRILAEKNLLKRMMEPTASEPSAVSASPIQSPIERAHSRAREWRAAA